MKYLTKINQFVQPIFTPNTFNKVFFLFLLLLFNSILYAEESAAEANKKIDKDIVSNLKASITPDSISIELNWTPPTEEGEVIIARSNEVIDTPEKLGVADSLGKHKSDKLNVFNTFKDINLRPGEYYYAIVLVSQIKKKKVKLFPGINHTIVPVVIPDRPKAEKVSEPTTPKEALEIDSIDNLKIKAVENSVTLTWSQPHDSEKTSPVYTIYRSLDPMHKIGLMDKATKIGEVTHPETTFTDIELNSSQTIYYGVSVTIDGKEKLPLEENKSFQKFYFVKLEKKDQEEINVITEKKDPGLIEKISPQVENLSAEIRKNGVYLSWSAPKGAIHSGTTYYVYESNKPIINTHNSTLAEDAKRIGTVIHPDVTFLHETKDKSPIIYYGVTIKNIEEEENTNLKEGQSFIKLERDSASKSKTKKQQVTAEDSNPDFNTIMVNYYQRQKYTEALIKFKSLADRVTDTSLRGKSLFYAALCHYHLSEYNKALKILLKEDVQMHYDKERIDFYVKRCLENRGNK